MKTKLMMLGIGALCALLVQGCVAFPPLIQVEHKDTVSNQDIARRLDAIDHRLDQLEKSSAPKETPAPQTEQKP